MKIPLDRRSLQPIYIQIRDRISRLIQAGTLGPGDRLPSIRTLAEEARVNKLTVIEAYSILEADGLIYARPGSGYFVQATTAPPPLKPATFAPAQKVIIPQQGKMSFFEYHTASMHARQQGDIIDFSSGFTRPTDLATLNRIARRAVKSIADTLFYYDFPQGNLTLRTQIAQMLMQKGLEISSDDLMITNGSMQGLSLMMHYHVQPGDWVIVETPTYHGALAILQKLGARVIGIPMTGDGMNLDLLALYLHSHSPKLIYTISTLHNPTGITTTLEHRQRLLDLAAHHGCPILEDNAYEGLSFGNVPPPIQALDSSGLVTYVGTFSKTLMPGFRIGYMVPPQQSYQPLLERKMLQDLNVSTVSQAIISEYLASGHYRRHLQRLQTIHLQSRNVMLQALERYFPPEVTWTVPDGGLFLWVQLPEHLPLQAMCHDVAAQGVLVTSGAAFFPNQEGYPAMRLNFAQPPEEIERGIEILGRAIQHHLRRASHLIPELAQPRLHISPI